MTPFQYCAHDPATPSWTDGTGYTRCKRCHLIRRKAKEPQHVTPGIAQVKDVLPGVIADWIASDISKGYSMDFLERQYGPIRVRRYLAKRGNEWTR
jgi:hypothetical protein